MFAIPIGVVFVAIVVLQVWIITTTLDLRRRVRALEKE